MSIAGNTAGLVGCFGATSFVSVSSIQSNDPQLPPKYPKAKFFKSRNLKDNENTIEEEEENVSESNSPEHTKLDNISGSDSMQCFRYGLRFILILACWDL